MQLILRVVFAALSVTFLPGAFAKAPLAAGLQHVRSVEGIDEYRLSNGLQVLLYPDATKPTTTVNVTYRVGSRFESYGETGMAHLLEHLMFKGSTRYPSPEKEFSRRGFRNNGTTSFDRTNYFSTFQAGDDNLRWALGWSADAMVHSFIAKKDLASEMTVVRNEYEMGETQPTQVMLKRAMALAFDWHNYGKLPIGNRSDIENVRIENLQAFYRTYYQPDNATLIVAGKFDPERTLGWITATFGKIPRPQRKLPTLWTVEPTQDGERSFVVRRNGDVQIVLLTYKIPSALHADVDALGVTTEILSNTPSGRLHKELVEKGLAAQTFGWVWQNRDPGVVMFGAVVKKGDPIERVRDRMIEVVESTFATTAAATAELDRVRKDSETSFERTLADPQEFGVGLSEYIAFGDWRLFFLARDRVNAVSANDVGDVASRYFRRDNRVVGLFLPEDQPLRTEVPAAPTAEQRLVQFKPRAAVAAGEVFDPSQVNIDRRTRLIQIGDLKLALLPKKTRGETVNVVMNFQWGDETSLAGRGVIPQLTEALVSRGTPKFDRQQIADEMTRLKMTGGLREFQTDRGNLADALRLAAHVLREASFPATEFDVLKRQIVTSLQAQLNKPDSRSRDLLQAHFNTYPEGDPRYYMPLQARIEATQKATLEEIRQFHAGFWGTARGQIAIVGDFDDRSAETLIRELFAGWASKAPYAPILREPREVKAERLFADTPDQENAFYRARIAVTLRDDDPDYAPLTLANDIFGGGSGLSNRLMDRVRQRDGISYGSGSGLLVNSRDRAGAWQIGGLVAPQNAARFAQAVREEIDRMLKEGFTAKEVDDARNGLLQQRALTRSEDAALAGAWTAFRDVDRTFVFSQAFEERIRSLTPADLLAAVRRHIDPGKMTVVIAGDAKKGAR